MKKGITEPFSQTERIDFHVINVKTENNFGQFVFLKSELINNGTTFTQTQNLRMFVC